MRAAALLVWLVLTGSVAAQAGPPAAPAALPEGVTETDQTFQRDDAPGAYAFAAPAIRQIFPDPDQFMSMVRRGYAPVYRPQAAEFTELAQHEGDLVQGVELAGPDGRRVLALYTMQRAPE